ncbi:unnamed protein product [Tenebrio molitor]|nr:unnamed protein product [Tenebrio molitor]
MFAEGFSLFLLHTMENVSSKIKTFFTQLQSKKVAKPVKNCTSSE